MLRRLRTTAAVLVAAGALLACDGGNGFTIVGTGGGGTGTAAIQGQVLADGSPLGGVRVVLVGQDSVLSNGAGIFTFTDLAAGTYNLQVRSPAGFTFGSGENGARTLTLASGGTVGATFFLTELP
ncbi:MAG TPA: carboxypeptidase-like regulatory domain-containing protein [Longimicrobium sp.]|nr:carboxypeptidase-like regulatory domain-containing protein [Longimicrobium sp.]